MTSAIFSLALSLLALAIALIPKVTRSKSRGKDLGLFHKLKVPKGLTSKEMVTSIAISGAILLPASALIGSPLPIIFSPLIFIKAAEAFGRARSERLRKDCATEWPNILSEVHLRITSLGSPIHHGLYSAAKSAKSTLREAFDSSERAFAITNSIELALDELYKNLPFTTTFRVTEALKVVLEVPGGDIGGIILDLKDDLEREARAQTEFEARLKGVKFARNFVVIVPVAMLLAGASIGGFSSYRTLTSILVLSVSAVVVLCCWIVVSRMTSPSSLYKGDVELIKNALRKRIQR
ncbi:MAG: hypothetical protein M0019_01430 [Actinomycetota bacterium]|nr:hypothetical protein [Actinomycetota bacterium]